MIRHHKKTFPWFLWHRRIGLAALVLLIILAVTGMALNHTEELKLDQKTMSNDWLLDWYGLNPTGHAVSFNLGDTRLTQWGKKIFFNEQLLNASQQQMIGAVRSGQIILVAFRENLMLLDSHGELIEQTSPEFMPIEKIGSQHDHIIIKAKDGQLYRADTHVVTWENIDARDIQWSQSETLPTNWQQKIKRAWRGDGLTAERVILDLHSGRLFNATWGMYVMDVAAIIMMVLGFSGVWIWWSRKIKISSKKHYQKHHR